MSWNKSLSLLTLGTLCSMGASLEAQAQDAEDKIQICRAEQDLSKRVECLEAMLRGEPFASVDVKEPAPPAVEPVALAEASSSAAQPIELGRDQIENRARIADNEPRDNARQTFSVLSTRKVPIEKLEITLENGQVWRQIKGDSSNIRVSKRYKDSLTVDIWKASISGYRLRLNEMKRTIRVERIK